MLQGPVSAKSRINEPKLKAHRDDGPERLRTKLSRLALRRYASPQKPLVTGFR
jgi:hypothetical protein